MTVIKSIPAPGSGIISALCFDGKYIWCQDVANTQIHMIDRNGNLIKTFACPNWSPVGIAFDGKYIWHGDNFTMLVYMLDRNGTQIKTFFLPANNIISIEFDGKYLWMMGGGGLLYQVDRNQHVISTIVDGPAPRDMAFDGRYMWIAASNVIYMIDKNLTVPPIVMKTIASAGANVIGITFDGKYLWQSDSITGRIYMTDRV